jgi:hypothetical protein
MKCPKCKTELPGTTKGRADKTDTAVKVDKTRTPEPEDAVRADAPPAPCPQCGWSVMWNE